VPAKQEGTEPAELDHPVPVRMMAVLFLIPTALFLGAIGLAAFLWPLRSGQYEDLDGAARRILTENDEEDDDWKNERR
jgi:cbb3-type cytochrome oxidase maturation protein